MSLKDIYVKESYDSDTDMILADFYIPVLSEAVKYQRIAGFFSSNSLLVAAKGISNFIKNNGNMELICGVFISKKDQEMMEKAVDHPEAIIESYLQKQIDNLETEIKKDHVGALGWLLSKGRLKIKIAKVNENEQALFHQKVGIIHDSKGNIISFSGSDNETLQAWTEHIEEFKTFKNWVKGQETYVQSDIDKFDRFWNDKAKRTEIYPLPEAIKQQILQLAPKNLEDCSKSIQKYIEKPVDHSENKLKKDVVTKDYSRLRDYQNEAINQWVENNHRGILEMATASGKTFTALMASCQLYEKLGDKLVTIVLVPSKQLVNQWGNEISKYSPNIVKVSSSVPNWKETLDDYIYLMNNGEYDHFYVVSTIASFTSNVIPELAKLCIDEILLIADEAHWLGAFETRSQIVNFTPKYRLGLTATPVRYFDDYGTNFLYDYLGKTVFQFSIKEAQDKRFLSQYYYHLVTVDLNAEETEAYKRITKAISIAYQQKDMEKYERLLNKRAKIIKNAVMKYDAFGTLLDEMGQIKFSLTYCDENQMERINKILREKDIFFQNFLAETSDVERDILIKKISDGSLDTIVAIKCLNEGVDIPPLEYGFFLSCSGNPREFIQRRGRLLRTSEGKGSVHMYDFVVIPPIGGFDDAGELEMNKKIVRKELNRIKEFNITAINRYDNELKIFKELGIIMNEGEEENA